MHDGEIILYWQNGRMKRRCHFSHGVRWGLDQMWNEEGVLVDEGAYEENKPVGVHRRWAPNGQLIEEITYFSVDRFNFLQWDEEGDLRVEARWIDESHYCEKAWDRFQQIWVEKRGHWDGKRLVIA